MAILFCKVQAILVNGRHNQTRERPVSVVYLTSLVLLTLDAGMMNGKNGRKAWLRLFYGYFSFIYGLKDANGMVVIIAVNRFFFHKDYLMPWFKFSGVLLNILLQYKCATQRSCCFAMHW